MDGRKTGEKLVGLARRLRESARSMVGLSSTCWSVADELEREAKDLLAATDRPARGSAQRTGAGKEADDGRRQ